MARLADEKSRIRDWQSVHQFKHETPPPQGWKFENLRLQNKKSIHTLGECDPPVADRFPKFPNIIWVIHSNNLSGPSSSSYRHGGTASPCQRACDNSYVDLLTWTFRVTDRSERYVDENTRTVTRRLLRVRYYATFNGSSYYCFPKRKTPLNGALCGVAVNAATKALRRGITENRCFLKIPERDNKNKQIDMRSVRHVLC
jgi:hypothetical protein